MNHGRLRSWALVASLLAPGVALAKTASDAGTVAPATDDDDETAAGVATPAPPPRAAPPAEATAPALPPVTSRWSTSLYGFVELDGMHDSTQSFNDGANGNSVARRGTYGGDRGQTQATVKNTRLGVKIGAPDFAGIRTSGQLEMDFFGLQPTDATQNDYYVLGTMRLRHAFMKFEIPVADGFDLDVLAGQYHDLFAWGGTGFFPNTVAFLGVPGEIYHRNPQLRVSAVVGRAITLEVAAAAVRPVQRHAEAPDVEGGIRLAFKKWSGVSSQGSGQPQLAPLAIGVSAVGRKFVIPEFIGNPRNSNAAYGWGVAVNAVLPIIPVTDVNHRGNALTVTGEYSIGSGIADLYTGMTAGAKFPELANPGGDIPPFTYPQDVDSGLVTYDADKNAKTYNWTAFLVGLQYYLPGGRIWLSGVYGQMQSNNMLTLTPVASWGAVFKSSRYADGNLFFQLTPAAQLGLSFQYTEQTYGDDALPSSNGVAGDLGPQARPINLRAEGAATFFF